MYEIRLMDDEVRFILPYTIHGMSNELHLILQGPACPTMLVYDTNNFVDTRDFVCVFDDLLPPNLNVQTKISGDFQFQISVSKVQ